MNMDSAVVRGLSLFVQVNKTVGVVDLVPPVGEVKLAPPSGCGSSNPSSWWGESQSSLRNKQECYA